MKVFVARQPIFDRQQRVYGYELLFRSGLSNFFDGSNQDLATARVIINSYILMGMESMTGGKRAFINFTPHLLRTQSPTLFPQDLIGVEILESVEPEEDIIRTCEALREQGYLLVLDDFVLHPRFEPLVDLAHIIKIDFLTTDFAERKYLVETLRPRGIKLLAERVESLEEYEQARELGYSYFQGFFFCKPDIMSGQDIQGHKASYMRVIHEINQDEPDFENIADIIEKDISLSYKVLKLVNSSAVGLPNRIQSIKQALVILGLREVKKWVTLITFRDAAVEKPSELIRNSLTRARFCELLAVPANLKNRSSELFLLGLFSRVDALLDRPMDVVLEELPMADDLKEALQGEDNNLTPFLWIMTAYERADWVAVDVQARNLNMIPQELAILYLEALEWTEEFFTIL